MVNIVTATFFVLLSFFLLFGLDWVTGSKICIFLGGLLCHCVLPHDSWLKHMDQHFMELTFQFGVYLHPFQSKPVQVSETMAKIDCIYNTNLERKRSENSEPSVNQ